MPADVAAENGEKSHKSRRETVRKKSTPCAKSIFKLKHLKRTLAIDLLIKDKRLRKVHLLTQC